MEILRERTLLMVKVQSILEVEVEEVMTREAEPRAGSAVRALARANLF